MLPCNSDDHYYKVNHVCRESLGYPLLLMLYNNQNLANSEVLRDLARKITDRYKIDPSICSALEFQLAMNLAGESSSSALRFTIPTIPMSQLNMRKRKTLDNDD